MSSNNSNKPNNSNKVLLWDMMGTVVDEPVFRVLPAFFNEPLDALYRAKHPTAWVDFEKGLIDEATFFRTFFNDGRIFDGPALRRAFADAYDYLPGMETLLATLCDTGIAMHVFSNYPLWYQLIEDKLAPSRFLPWTFVSHHTGYRKPDLEAYQHALNTLHVPASQCLFIDDRPVNCQAAQACGIDAIVFKDAESVQEALRQRGVL